MNDKIQKRAKRAKKTSMHIKRMGIEKGVARMIINRSSQHIYAQILSPVGGKVLASASSVEKDVRAQMGSADKKGIAKIVGQLIAERAKQAGVEKVACDRSGFKYHGRIAALVDSARETGLAV